MARKAFRKSKKKFFTLTIAPNFSSGKIFQLRIPHWAIISLVAFVSIFAVYSIFNVIYASNLSQKLVQYEVLKSKAAKQQEQIKFFSYELKKLKKNFSSLSKNDSNIRKTLGLPEKKSSVTRKDSYAMVSRSSTNIVDMKKDLNEIYKMLKEKNTGQKQVSNRVAYLKRRFAATPSMWPLYGNISSPYGYRYSPWPSMHTGIDITSFNGAPVRATADGVVTEAGWKSGYGITVTINHQNGYQTLYAHNSRSAVQAGDWVKKGDVICYVGMTGFTTGPHCHYEVIRNGAKINPASYLNLDIFSVAQVW